MKTEVAVTGGGRAREVGGTLSTLTLSLGAWPPLVMAHVEAGSLMEEARVMKVFMVSGCPQAATCLLQLWRAASRPSPAFFGAGDRPPTFCSEHRMSQIKFAFQ